MSNNFNNTSDNNDDDDEDIMLKRLNSKISVMIAEAEAALNSKAEVTELEMILAEEKERDERIMKEFGIQTLNIHNYNYNNYNINYNNNHNYLFREKTWEDPFNRHYQLLPVQANIGLIEYSLVDPNNVNQI
uniref:Uncharacterized protein n=1 Tax=Rhizophagus irregularis (strain DAOM 181602 / DAOM 197198 / MUCL 43194) TaxID=747089 RepID=U9UFK0_RHIID